jgi:PAS domain S-box-containing protein
MPEKTNERLLLSEHNLRILINNTDDAIWLVNSDYIVVECNHTFKKWISHFLGKELDKGDCVLHEGLDKAYVDKFEMCYRLAFGGKAFKSVEDINVDGKTRYTTVSFTPVFDDDGKVMAVSCFARDITEQRKHLLKIEEQNTALREIAFIESHKVRGPVATILGLGQFFNTENLSDPLNKEIISGILSVANELDTIIRQVVKKSNEMGLK